MTVFSFWFLCINACAYIWIRNHLVYIARKRWLQDVFDSHQESIKTNSITVQQIKDDYENYAEGYDTMMYKFWVWPLDKFRNPRWKK